jgi:hypothetical protein
MYNKRWISKIASSPRLSSSLQGARGLLPIVYFKEFSNGVATWREANNEKPTQVKKI